MFYLFQVKKKNLSSWIFNPWLLAFWFVLAQGLFFNWNFSFASPPEVELGKKIFEEIRPQLGFSQNPLLQAYVQKMAKRILHQVPPNQFEFRFFILKSDQLNAFALPNGYIFLTERLLNSVNNETELAFVLCHETAHVIQTHFRRLMEQKSKVDIATMAAMVAGLLLAKDTELQTAIHAFSLGSNQTFLFKYSREFEDEADEIGFRYLTGAGYEGNGAMQFMEKLRCLERITIVPPVYLSTHPSTLDRVQHLEQLNRRHLSSPTEDVGNFRRFRIWSALETGHFQTHLQSLEKDLQKNPNNLDTLYSLGIVSHKLGRNAQASTYFEQGLKLNPDDHDILRDYGISLSQQGKYKDALHYLNRATIKGAEDDFLAFHYLGKIQKEMSQIDEAIANLLKSKELQPDFPDNYFLLGLLYQQKGQLKEAHQNFGRHFTLLGNQRAASFHYQEADKDIDKDKESLNSNQKTSPAASSSTEFY